MNFKDKLNELSQKNIETEKNSDNINSFNRINLNDTKYQKDTVSSYMFDLTDPNKVEQFEGYNNQKSEVSILDLTSDEKEVLPEYNDNENKTSELEDFDLLVDSQSMTQNELHNIFGFNTETKENKNDGLIVKSSKLDVYKKKPKQEIIDDYINSNINFWYRMNALYIKPENIDPKIVYERLSFISDPEKTDFNILRKKNFKLYRAIEESLDELKNKYGDLITEIKNNNIFKGNIDLTNAKLEDIDISSLKVILTDKYGSKIHNFLKNHHPYAKVIKNGVIEQESKDLSAFKSEFEVDVIYDVLGYSAIFPFLKNPEISEIMTIGPHKVYIELEGKLIKTKVSYCNEEPLKRYAKEIAGKIDRPLDSINLSVDSRLPDGSRFHAILPPIARFGTTLTIRKFSEEKLTLDNLIVDKSLTKDMAHFIRSAVASRLNIVVAGGTGSGKTTMLNICSNYIGKYERVITAEDSAELQLTQDHVVSLETKEAKDANKSRSYAIRDLVKECLRMRPDRIICGECRGGEAWDMLVAMNTGHEGSMTTVHSNNPIDTIKRIANMVAQVAGDGVPMRVIYEQIASSVELVIYQSRLFDGSRKTTYISEIRGYNVITQSVEVVDLYRYVITGEDNEGKIQGYFEWTGNLPSPDILYKIHSKGYTLPQNMEDALQNRKDQAKSQYTLMEEKDFVDSSDLEPSFKERLKIALECLYQKQSENELEIIEQLETIPLTLRKKLVRLLESDTANKTNQEIL